MKKTVYITHPTCHLHDPNPGHPECPARLAAIEEALAGIPGIEIRQAKGASRDDLLLAHDAAHIETVFQSIPSGAALNFLDPDTALCARSGEAALCAAGAVLDAVALVCGGSFQNAFCGVRPPGHHAHRGHAAGFCLFNNVAIGALAALARHSMRRVAILDFDVHHGDGTQDIIKDNPRVFFASSFQHPLYASQAGMIDVTDRQAVLVNKAFPAGTPGASIVTVWKNEILPQLENFKPDMIFVSAGFDGHRDDPIGGLAFVESDYAELMRAIKETAERWCEGRLVAVLEGGYNLEATAQCVSACLNVMGE